MKYVTRPCPVCSKTETMEIDQIAYLKWLAGTLIQDAFPTLTINQRELIITGTHPVCWDILHQPESDIDVDTMIDIDSEADALLYRLAGGTDELQG